MARTSNNSVDKKLEAVSTTKMAEKDPLHNIDLELSSTLKQMFEEAIRWIKKAETYLRDNKILTDDKTWFSDDEIIAIYGEEEK